MSYILDALKRAERERKQGQVSVLDEIPAAQAAAVPKTRLPQSWLFAAIGVAALTLLVFTVLAWKHHGGKDAGGAAPPLAATRPPPPAQPLPPPEVTRPDAPPQAPTATIEDGARIATLDDVSEPPPPVQPAGPGPGAGQQPGPAPAAPPRPPPGPPPGVDLGQAKPKLRLPVLILPPQDTAAAPPSQATTSVDNVPPAAPAAEVAQASDTAAPPPPVSAPSEPAQQALREMPESFRANFPAFTVDVHAYNSSPQRRFVLISGKRYREGDTLAEGPRIVAIVPEGMVLEWQGQKVLYAIAH